MKHTPSGFAQGLLSKLSLDKETAGLRNYLYDYRRFKSHSSTYNPEMSDEALAARITKQYHRLEKGLALPEPRPGFALSTIDWLIVAVPKLEGRGHAPLVAQGARQSVRAWVEWHEALGEAGAAHVRPDIRAFGEGADGSVPAGALRLTRAEIEEAGRLDFDRFARTRYSVRQFTGAPVDPAEIARAVETALKTPRVCNRESRRVHVGFSAETRARMLAHQNGNRGFGHLAGAVVIVTSDLRHFTDFGERNQAWIDGGMFAMSLAYALHGQGLGSCMLNWSAEFWRDRRMRAEFAIPEHEAVVTFMAVGHLPEEMWLAVSPRPPAEEVIRVIG